MTDIVDSWLPIVIAFGVLFSIMLQFYSKYITNREFKEIHKSIIEFKQAQLDAKDERIQHLKEKICELEKSNDKELIGRFEFNALKWKEAHGQEVQDKEDAIKAKDDEIRLINGKLQDAINEKNNVSKEKLLEYLLEISEAISTKDYLEDNLSNFYHTTYMSFNWSDMNYDLRSSSSIYSKLNKLLKAAKKKDN